MREDFMSFRSQHSPDVVKNDEERIVPCFYVDPADTYRLYREPRDPPLSLTLENSFYLTNPCTDPVTVEVLMKPRYKSEKEGPNAAWTSYVKHLNLNPRAENLFIFGSEREDLRSWGYVFWDYSTLESLGFKCDDVID